MDETGRREANAALAFRIALKIAESRRIVRELRTPVTITLLNPVYKETGRMQRREDHPHGEDSIRCKIRVLRRLEALNRSSDRSPGRHRRRVPERIGRNGRSDPARVRGRIMRARKYRALFLGDAIDARDPELPTGLTHKDGREAEREGGRCPVRDAQGTEAHARVACTSW